MASVVFETMPGGYSDRYPAPAQRYYPGTYMEEYPQYAERRAYRTYAGKDYRRDGFDYVTTREPFQPDHDYYQKEYKRPYVYRDNRLYHTKDPVRKYYDGSGNVTVTVVDGDHQKDKGYSRYSQRERDEPYSSVRGQFYPKERHEEKHEQEELEVGYMVEHLASFDVGEDCDPSHAGHNIESAIETLRNMDQDKAILPLRCYLTYKDEEVQVLSDKELSVLEWIKYDDVNLVSAEVHQLDHYEDILLVQAKNVIHLFCPCGDCSAEELAKNCKERVSKRRDHLDEQRGSRWEEDRSNKRFLLNDETIKKETDVDFYDKYTMQLYGRVRRDYVARNDKELTVMNGEGVEIQSTRGQWWLCRLSNGKSGYVPSDCLESYVPSPAGLPRTTLRERGGRGRDRDMDSVSERGSVISAAQSRYRDGGRDYYDGRRDHKRDDRRGYDRDRGRPRDDMDTRSMAGRQGFGSNNFANQGLGSGFGTGLGAGLSGGFGNGMNGLGVTGLGNGLDAAGLSAGLTANALGSGFGTVGPSSLAGLGAGLGTGMNGLGTAGLAGYGLGNGFGSIGPSAGFSTVSSATAAGLFPQGFTSQLQQGRPIPMTGSVRGNPLMGVQQLGNPALGLGIRNQGVPTLGTGLGTMGVPRMGVQGTGIPVVGVPGVRPTLGMPGQGGFRLM